MTPLATKEVMPHPRQPAADLHKTPPQAHGPGASPAGDKGYYVTPEKLAEMYPGKDTFSARKELRSLLADERDRKPRFGPTPRPEGVRAAVEKDEKAIFDLLMIDLKEQGAEKIAKIGPERILQHIQFGTRGHGGMVGVIDGPNDTIVASVGILPCQWWWSEGRYLQDMWSFVHPDHRRGTDHARKLIDFSCWVTDIWSEQYGNQLYLLTGVLATKRAKSKWRFFKRLVTQIGVVCLYPAPPDINK